MPKVLLNLAGVHKQELLAEGRYRTEIMSAKADVSQSGNPILRVVWKIVDGKQEGRTQPDHINLTGKPEAMAITRDRLETILGDELPDPDDKAAWQDYELDTDDMIGWEGWITIKHGEDQQGEVRSQVRGVKAYKPGLEDVLSK